MIEVSEAISLVEQAADTFTRRQPLPAGIQVAANKAIGN